MLIAVLALGNRQMTNPQSAMWRTYTAESNMPEYDK